MRPLFVANWKMNTTLTEALLLASCVKEGVAGLQGVDVVLCPPFPFLVPVAEELHRHKIAHLYLGAQNIGWQESGAYTGEVSAPMLKGIADYVIIGHSERRQYFQETDDLIAKKVALALSFGLRPILCVGELKKPSRALLDDPSELSAHQIQRPLDELEAVLDRLEGLAAREGRAGDGAAGDGGGPRVSSDYKDKIIVAYEPVWAVSGGSGGAAGAGGTGNAGGGAGSSVEAASGHYANAVAGLLKEAAGFDVPVLYGGSVKPDNAREFTHQENLNGLLVGGASLKTASFVSICAA